jgi:hypothetical protein
MPSKAMAELKTYQKREKVHLGPSIEGKTKKD